MASAAFLQRQLSRSCLSRGHKALVGVPSLTTAAISGLQQGLGASANLAITNQSPQSMFMLSRIPGSSRSTACHASTSSLSSPAWAPGPQIDVRGPLRGHASTAPTASASKAMAQSAGGSAFRALPLAHVSVPVGEHVAHQHQRFSTAARATSSDQAPSAPAEADASDDNDDLAITCLRCTVSDLPGEEADMLSDVLLSFGAQSVVVQEHRPPGAPEQEIFEDGGQSQLWDHCDVVAHFPLDHDVDTAIALCANVLEKPESYPFILEPIANESWVEQIKASYVPLSIADPKDAEGPPMAWIIPEWSEIVDPSAINIMLTPGVAFGTGEHPTTRLCLQALRLHQERLQGACVMDYGCGSGVLALAAVKLGASSAICTDVDSLAVKATARNAVLNSLQQSVQVYVCGAGIDDAEPLAAAGVSTPQRTFDVVVSNILRGPLLELCPRLTSYARPGALLVLSGVLLEQALEVQALYSRHFEGFEIRTDGNWAVVTATRKVAAS